MLFYGGWFDVGYGLVLIGLVVSLWASWNVKSTFRRYQNDHNSRGLTAAQVARQILDDNGLYQIRIERVSGNLTDHYDPKGNVIRLSDSVTSDSTSVAAIGVAAHEWRPCGAAFRGLFSHAGAQRHYPGDTDRFPARGISSFCWA